MARPELEAIGAIHREAQELILAATTREESAQKLELVLIPLGTFVMGSPDNVKERETPETSHSVTLTRPFSWASTRSLRASTSP